VLSTARRLRDCREREGDREQPDSNGRPMRTLGEVHESASTHDLPVLDDVVPFSDLRPDYEWSGRREIEHVEVQTSHDRDPRAAAERSGFKGFRGSGPRVEGGSDHSRRGARVFGPDFADEFL
jgi:hypothetical protein